MMHATEHGMRRIDKLATSLEQWDGDPSERYGLDPVPPPTVYALDRADGFRSAPIAQYRVLWACQSHRCGQRLRGMFEATAHVTATGHSVVATGHR